jgi:hypothetical protein
MLDSIGDISFPLHLFRGDWSTLFAHSIGKGNSKNDLPVQGLLNVRSSSAQTLLKR